MQLFSLQSSHVTWPMRYSNLQMNNLTCRYLLWWFVAVSHSTLLLGCELDHPPRLEQGPDYGFPTSFDQDIQSTDEIAAGDIVSMTDMSQADSVDEAGTDNTMSQSIWPTLSGYWQIEHHTTLRSELPVLLEEVETVVKATLIAEITQETSRVWIHHKLCDVNMQNTPGYNQTIIPDRFIQSLPIQTRQAHLIKQTESDETGELSQYRLSVPLWYDLRGVFLENPIEEALPIDAMDSRVFDQDLDGKPGLSAYLIGFPDGDVSLIQKSWDEWEGQVETALDEYGVLQATSVQGQIIWGQEQKIIEASNEVLLIDIDRWIPPEPELHFFEMIPIDSLACPLRRESPRPDQ